MNGFSDFDKIKDGCDAKTESGCGYGGPCNIDECPRDGGLDRQARAAMLGQPKNLESFEQSAFVVGFAICAFSGAIMAGVIIAAVKWIWG